MAVLIGEFEVPQVQRCDARPVETETGRIVVTRPGGHYRDAIRAYVIKIDGEERGVVSAGESLTLAVPAGTRSVQASIDWTGSPAVIVDVGAGEEVALVVEPAGSSFFVLFQMFRPTTYLRLTAQDPA